MRPVILVGIRYGQADRDRNWAFNLSRWRDLDWPVFEGVHGVDEGPFCMAVASNRAAALATENYDWDVAVYVGADFAAQHLIQAEQAAASALRTGRLTFAHTHLSLLDEAETAELAQRDPRDALVLAPAGTRHPNTFSGVLAVTRELWERVGGFDERFVGWGFEDLAFLDACNAIGGGYDRVDGDIYHLWHPTDRAVREESPTHGLNQVLWERYRAVRSSCEGMCALLSEPGGPLSERQPPLALS